MNTTDTLMQSGGEQALIAISLQKKIPILSSNKGGIENGSSFGAVADFYTLGKISGQQAVQILHDKIAPSKLQSELQEPPLFLSNRRSMEVLGIKIPAQLAIKIQWTE